MPPAAGPRPFHARTPGGPIARPVPSQCRARVPHEIGGNDERQRCSHDPAAPRASEPRHAAKTVIASTSSDRNAITSPVARIWGHDVLRARPAPPVPAERKTLPERRGEQGSLRRPWAERMKIDRMVCRPKCSKPKRFSLTSGARCWNCSRTARDRRCPQGSTSTVRAGRNLPSMGSRLATSGLVPCWGDTRCSARACKKRDHDRSGQARCLRRISRSDTGRWREGEEREPNTA